MAKQRFDAWVLSAILRKLYDRHKFESMRQGARFVFANKDTLNRWLSGETQIFDPPKVYGVAGRLGASEEMAQLLFELAVQTHNTDTSGYHQAAHPSGWKVASPFAVLEATASRLDIYEDTMITGLLQIPAYIKAMGRSSPLSTPEHSEGVMRYKLDRQAEVFSDPPEMRIVMNEQALLRIAHEPFYDAQIRHMLDMSERHEIGIYVLPLAAGLYPTLAGSFTILGFDNPSEREFVFIEAYSMDWVEDRNALAKFHKLFNGTLQQVIELGAYVNADRAMAEVQS